MRAHMSIAAVLVGVHVHMEASQAGHWPALLHGRGAWLWTQTTVGQEAVFGARDFGGTAAVPRGAAGTTWDWSWRDLQLLPGIGPRRASLIVEARHIDAYAQSLPAQELRRSSVNAAVPSSDGAAQAAGAEIAGAHVAGASREWSPTEGTRAKRTPADSRLTGPAPTEGERRSTAAPSGAATKTAHAGTGHDELAHSGAWRSFGPELLECLPGIGPATVAALRLHWKSAEPSRARGPRAHLDDPRRPGASVEYTPQPARPP